MSSDANPDNLVMYGHDADPGAGRGAMEDAAGAEKMEAALAASSDQDHLTDAMDAAAPLMSVASNQLTLLFQGEIYVFESVSPEKVCSLSPISVLSWCLCSKAGSNDNFMLVLENNANAVVCAGELHLFTVNSRNAELLCCRLLMTVVQVYILTVSNRNVAGPEPG